MQSQDETINFTGMQFKIRHEDNNKSVQFPYSIN